MARMSALVLVITRPSILGLMYAASRAYAKVPFHLYSAKSIVERARALGFELTRRENLLPHDASLGLRKAAR